MHGDSRVVAQLRVELRLCERGDGGAPIGHRWHRATKIARGAVCVVTASALLAHAQSTADSRRGRRAPDTRSLSSDTNPSPRATLTGRVVDSAGTPVAQAVVALVGTRDSAVTTDDGRFVVRNVSPGAYMVNIGRIGFRPKRYATTLASGPARDATIILTRFVPVLATVTTTAEQRAAYRAVGFDQRMQVGIGQFLTHDQIVRRQPMCFTDLLHQLRGIWVNGACPPGAGVTGTRGVGSCVSYVVDGFPLTLIGGESPDNLIEASQVGAIEVYSASERPAGFGGMEEHPMPVPGTPLPKVGLDRQQCVLVKVWTTAKLGLVGLPAGGGARPSATGATAGGGVTQGRTIFVPDAECRPVQPLDTTDLVIYATVEGAPPPLISDTAWAQYRDRVLAALDRWSALPSDLVLPSMGLPFAKGAGSDGAGPGRHPDLVVTPTLSTVLLFTLDATGALRSAHIVATSLSPSADTSMLAMVERTGTAHDFPVPPANDNGWDSIRLYLVVESVAPTPGKRGAVLGQLEVPVWRLTRPARLALGPQPTDAGRVGRDASHADSVTVKMVVDAAGQPVMRTAQLEVSPLSAGRPQVESETHLLAMLPQVRFEPALIGTCRVPQLVVQTFAAHEDR